MKSMEILSADEETEA